VRGRAGCTALVSCDYAWVVGCFKPSGPPFREHAAWEVRSRRRFCGPPSRAAWTCSPPPGGLRMPNPHPRPHPIGFQADAACLHMPVGGTRADLPQYSYSRRLGNAGTRSHSPEGKWLPCESPRGTELRGGGRQRWEGPTQPRTLQGGRYPFSSPQCQPTRDPTPCWPFFFANAARRPNTRPFVARPRFIRGVNVVAVASTEVGPPRGRKTFVKTPRHFVGPIAAWQGAGNGRGLCWRCTRSSRPTFSPPSEAAGACIPAVYWDTFGAADPRLGTEAGEPAYSRSLRTRSLGLNYTRAPGRATRPPGGPVPAM
jgi:hypothetical protein